MQLDPSKTLEDNYHTWLAQQKEDAKFFTEAWAHKALTEQSTPNKSREFLHELQSELPSSYAVVVDASIDNSSRVLFEEAQKDLEKMSFR